MSRNLKNIVFSIFIIFENIDAAYAGNDWLSDEVLNQLQELRKEVKNMRSEIADLKDEISHLKLVSDSGVGSAVKPVKLENDPSIGSKDTQIAIVEFSDFECPYCTRHNKQTLPQLKDSYIKAGQVQYIMKDFPLDSHRRAKKAAIAANCAGQQGHYEAMRNVLFDNRAKLGDEFYVSEAKRLGLNESKFSACMDDPAQIKEVEDDLASGLALGVRGTPAFFIGKVKNGEVVNAVPITGAASFSRFQKIIDKLLSES